MTHTARLIEREDGLFAWHCDCGQSSDSPHPGTRNQVVENMTRHVKDWKDYEALLVIIEERAKNEGASVCWWCDKVIPEADVLSYKGGPFHYDCFKESREHVT